MLNIIYSSLRFVFEITCVFLAGYCGFKLDHKFVSVIVGIMLPLMIVIIWSIWGAPASPNRLLGLGKLVFELVIYAGVALLMYNVTMARGSIIFITAGIINAMINYFLTK